MHNVFGWKTAQGIHSKKKSIEGVTKARASTCRYIWTYKAYIKQQQEVFLEFIDDFSRKTWIYFLHEKSETFTMFRSYKACVEKETCAYLTCLRID